MSTPATVNGVDTAAIETLRTKLQNEPEAGDTLWKAEVTWRGGFLNEIRIRDLPPSYADEPKALGGSDTAPNPVEQLLGALGSCLAIGYTANAALRGIQIQELRVELEGHLDLPVFLGLHEGHAGYSGINVRVHLKADAPQEVLEELHQHVLRTSPVGQTIEKAIPLHATLLSD
ncbi:OsmC family protein [Thermogemmatispora sp.]|uniref:OsmC family protein n=1 Tax=Thermogemmatispora sp. TaxID=1968838 RepID=UPI0035E40613